MNKITDILKSNYLLQAAVVLIGIFSSCSRPAVNNIDPVCGLASPVVFNSDTAEFYLSDYILQSQLVDTILFPEEITVIERSDSARYLLVKSEKMPLLSVLTARLVNGKSIQIPIKNRQKEKVTISFDPGKNKYQSVKVRGEMNYWNALSSKMKKVDGKWVEEFSLAPGEYQYLLLADGHEILNPGASDSIDNNMGGFNSLLKVGNYHQEDLPLILTESANDNIIRFSATQPLNQVLVFWQNRQIEFTKTGTNYELPVPAEAESVIRSYIRVYGANKHGFSNDLLIPLENGKVVTNTDLLSRTDRQTMIMYFMMIDRFRNGNPSNDEKVEDPLIHPRANYYGGDLQGVLKTMQEGYFDKLGVNTIWLSPITQNPSGAYGLYPEPRTTFSGYHGYWPVSSTKIDYRFGTGEDLENIVSLAHTNGQNVLLDYVANHVHEEHPVYKEHPDWATNLYLPDSTLNTEKWDEYRLTTWFDTFLPTLDLRKPEVVEAMTDSALFWIEEYGIDGFRHDATKHIDELFWRRLTAKLKQATDCDPMVYQIGETYGSPELINSYISTGMLDGQFDFNLYDNAVAAFGRDEESLLRLKNALTQSLQYYGYHNLMGNITGNQDRPRFISLAGGSLRFDEDAKYAGWNRSIEVGDPAGYDKLLMLHAFNFTIPGIPVIYYGDEIGLPGGNDPDNRRWMKFDSLSPEEQKVKNTVEKLADIRNRHMALLYGDLKFLEAGEEVLVYTRKYFEDEVLVIFNKSAQEKDILIEIEKRFQKSFVTSFEGKVEELDNSLRVMLPPRSFDILILE